MSYNILLKSAARSGNYQEVVRLVETIQQEGIAPSVVTLNTVLDVGLDIFLTIADLT